MVNGHPRSDLKIFACDSARDFATKVVFRIRDKYKIDIELGKSKEVWFEDGEVKIVLEETVRGSDAYFVQLPEDRSFVEESDYKHKRTINDNIAVLECGLDALRRSGARYITAVLPYFPYARQEKQKDREPITARIIADRIQDAGATGVFSMDIHADAIVGFFRVPFDNLRASPIIVKYLQENYQDILNNASCATPDAGGAARANYYAQLLGFPLVVGHKTRDYTKPDIVQDLEIIGNTKGRNIITIDDLISTAGTIATFAEKAKERGALGTYAIATHGILVGSAESRLKEAYNRGKGPLKQVFITDTIKHCQSFLERNQDLITVVSITDIIGDAIYRCNNDISVSELKTIH